MIIKTPINSRKKITKNFSCGEYDSTCNNKTIFKISDRLLSSNTLALLSKNHYNMSRNYIYLMKRPNPNNEKMNRLKKYRFKSYDNNKCDSIYPYTQTKTPKISYSTIEETKNKKLSRQSYVNLNDINKLNKRESQIILPGVQSPSVGKEPEKPRKFMQINKILNFIKIKKKEEAEKDLSPMQLGKDYDDFIEKKNKIFFNPNFNSPFIHEMNSNYMVNKNLLKKIQSGFKTTKLKIKIKNRKEKDEEFELELKDKMEEISIELENYKKEIKIFLTDEIKLNQIYINEKFFDSFTNKINFLFDDRKYPTIKNNLNKIKVEIKTTGGYEWNRLNMIELPTLTYLHKLKAKIQRELDEIQEGDKEIQFKINQQIGIYDYKSDNNKKRKKIFLKNKENEKTKQIEENKSLIKDNENNLRIKELLEEEEKEYGEGDKIEEKEDLYELEEFFVHKGRPYKKIDFAVGKLAYTVYHNPKFYIQNKIIKDDKSIIKNKKEFDLYL